MQTKTGIQRDRDFPQQDIAAKPIDDGHQIEKPALEADVGDITTPDLIASFNVHSAQQVGSAHQLPYPDATFDLITLFVVFSSILSEPLRQSIADEIWRVRRPGGLILCYDFTYSNPRNPAVVGISRQQIQQLFKSERAQFDFRRVTLAPPISRRITPRAYWFAYLLEQIKLFNTHMIGIISMDDTDQAEKKI